MSLISTGSISLDSTFKACEKVKAAFKDHAGKITAGNHPSGQVAMAQKTMPSPSMAV
jgi:hypothetical protein